MELQSLKQRFGITGNDEAMNRALEVAVRVAPTDLSVLITGESGVGKEFFPQIIHAYSSRKHNNYIAVNCGAIPEGTIDSELFGHEKGAFTGATESRKGYFEVADGGTIFLDEVAELPLTTQVRLLRVLQTGEFIRVGSSKPLKTDVRVVAATNINLMDAIAKGRFREDLYYRLNTVPIHVPPLRERKEDIGLLFRKFAADIAIQYKMPAITLNDDARYMLENYYWKGNVRQLKNVAEQISAIEESRLITAEILRKYLPGDQRSVPAVVAQVHKGDTGDERELLYKVLFDLKADVRDMRAMLGELMSMQEVAGEFGAENTGGTAKFIPGVLAPVRANQDEANSYPEYVETEEIDDEPVPTKEQVMREAVIRALKRHNGKRRDAAKELFISERTLYRKIKELGIEGF